MPKMAQLICAIKASDWGYMQKLIDRFVSGSEALKNLVKQKLKIKKGKDKGKGSQLDDASDHDEDDDADLCSDYVAVPSAMHSSHVMSALVFS